MYKDKITVVIQGPLHPNSLISIRSLTKDFSVVVSTWKTSFRDEKNLDNLLERGDYVTIVSHSIDSLKPLNNEANRYYQFFSTLKGVLMTTTEYVIKMRSDEYYTDLIPFAKKMLSNPEKLITNDVFFRNPETDDNENFLCHPSDHLFGGKTAHIRKMLELSVEDCATKSNDDLVIKFADLKNRSYNIVPEQQMFGNFILAKNPKYSFQTKAPNAREEIIKLMKENCEIVPSTELGFYSISFNDSSHNRKFCFYPDEVYFNPQKDLRKI
jgi:hypothetical protein